MLVGDGGDFTGVTQQPSHEGAAYGRKLVFTCRVEESVAFTFK